jgi:aminocarboxymuconate-semialdehyde decarboxylase
MPNRRDFLRNVGASAGVIFVGCSLCEALAAKFPEQSAGAAATARRPTMVGKRHVKTIDVHSHVSVPEAAELVKGTKLEGRGRAPGGYNDLGLSAERIAAMDKMGIDVQAVSINSFWYGADEELASKLVDLQNEKLAELCAAQPDRFVAFASVALQFPEMAAKQLEDGMKKHGLRGVAIGPYCEGKELSDPMFDPFWAKAEELQALIFVHPQNSENATGIRARVQGSGDLGNVIGNPLETTMFLSHIIFEGTLDKFPNLKICAAHAGGFLASYPDRMDHGCLVFPDQCKKTLKKPPSEYLKQIYFDSIIFTQEGLRHLIAEVGADRIALGTDYPFPWSVTPVDQVMALPGLSEADRISILGGTIGKLLKIPA